MGNNLLNETLTYNGPEAAQTKIRLITYNKDGVKRFNAGRIGEVAGNITEGNVNWIIVDGLGNPDAVKEVCDRFNVNFLLTQDILNTRHTPKIEEYNDYNVVIMKIFDKQSEDNRYVTRQVSMIQGKDFVLTFIEKENNIFSSIIHAIGKNILDMRSKSADYLLGVQMNSIISNYISLSEKLGQQLDTIEDKLMTAHSEEKIGAELHTIRRHYMAVRKAVTPIKEQYTKILQSESKLYSSENRIYFNDINDHLRLIYQDLDICRETLSSLLDLYMSNNDMYMNSIMKKLTIVSTIFIPLTFFAGIWGMNFTNMPELSWEYGYLMAWGIILVTAGAIFLYFKKKKWF